jgi:hypothetical protein
MMKMLFPLLMVSMPFVLLLLIFMIPPEVLIPGLKPAQASSALDTLQKIQAVLLWACPTTGFIASIFFASFGDQRSWSYAGRWFYAIVAVLYAILLFLAVVVLNWKQTS